MASRQIQIAQDDFDQAELVAWLSFQADLRCLPAVAEWDAEIVPRNLSECRERRSVVFFSQFADLVVEGASRPDPDSSRTVFASPDNDGLVFEWKKTAVQNGNAYMPTARGGSRLYFRAPPVPTPASDALTQLVSSLFRWVRRSHPWVSEARHPVFIGASLGSRVRSGAASLIHPNGKPIALLPNPKYRGMATH